LAGMNEAQTRLRLIDPQLRHAEWRLDDRTQVRFEIPVDGYDAEPSPASIRKAYGLKVDNFLAFVRHVLALEALPGYGQVVRRAFERFIAAHQFNADQIRFLRSIQEVFLAKRSLAEADLYDAPLTQFGRNAVDRYFSPAEIKELLDLASGLAA
jgi:type I restriction enzyme, R subunit